MKGLSGLFVLLTFVFSFGEENVCHLDGTCENTVTAPKGANAHGKPRTAVRECLDRHEQCKAFHKQGECTKNPGWMIINCPKICNACELRDPKLRCSRTALNMSTSPIYPANHMNTMFEGIVDKWGK